MSHRNIEIAHLCSI